jgi:hypothetical protein
METRIMKIVTTITIFLSFALCGCVRSVTSSQYRSNVANEGIVYSLPKTRLQVTITYTIRSTTQLKNGVPGLSTKKVLISKPVEIKPLLVPDTDNTFVISGENLVKDSRLDASFNFQVTENQLLAAVSSEARDKSPEIIQGLVGSGIAIAKMAATAGEETKPALLKAIDARLEKINIELKTLVESADEKKVKKMDQLLKEQAKLLEMAKSYLKNNAEQMEEKDIVYTQIVDPGSFTSDNKCTCNNKEMSACTCIEIGAPAAMLGVAGQNEVPNITIELFANKNQIEYATKAKNKFFSSQDSETPIDGVLYRVPAPIRVRVTVAPKNVVVFDDEIPFAQLGPINKVDAKYKMMASRKTRIIFSPHTGSIKEYGVEATSSAEAAAQALDTSLSKLQTAVASIKKNQDAAEAAKKTPEQNALDELNMRKKLLEAESDLIKAQQELDKLKTGSGTN